MCIGTRSCVRSHTHTQFPYKKSPPFSSLYYLCCSTLSPLRLEKIRPALVMCIFTERDNEVKKRKKKYPDTKGKAGCQTEEQIVHLMRLFVCVTTEEFRGRKRDRPSVRERWIEKKKKKIVNPSDLDPFFFFLSRLFCKEIKVLLSEWGWLLCRVP